MLESALSGDENWAFADKAYDSKKNHKILKRKGISNRILIKATRKRALTVAEKRCNISRTEEKQTPANADMHSL